MYRNILEILDHFERENRECEKVLKAGPGFRGKFYLSVIFPNTEKFIPITAYDGTTRLMPGNQNLILYRGQTKNYPSCQATIYRQSPNQLDIFIARLRHMEFEIVLREHAAVRNILDDGIHISFIGLAQHYELATDYLDVTSDPYVAAFFAVCRYSRKKQRYVPIANHKGKGVLMKTPALVFPPSPAGTFKLEILGLQPFPRPGNQKAYAVRLGKGEEFPAHKMLFHHDLKSSRRIFEMFEGGEKLFPPDPIAKKAQQIADGQVFTHEALKEVISRYNFPDTPHYYEQQLQQEGIQISHGANTIFRFTASELDKFNEDWKSHGKTAFYNQIGNWRLG